MEHTRVRWIARCSLGMVLLAAAAGCAQPPGNTGAVDAQDTGTAGASASAAPSPTASPVVPSRPAVSSPAPRGGVPGPDRAVLLQAVDRVEDPVLTVTASGRIGTYPGGADTGEREQFALVPLSPGAKVYLLKTARLRVGGEPVCAGVKGGVLHAVPCDAAAQAQKATLVARGTDGSGAATFEVVVGGYRVEVGADGKVSLVKAGSAAARTGFRFVAAGTVGQWP